MDVLEKQGRLDNTVIIFMADNGYFFGEHRRGDKRQATRAFLVQ
jgi:arylsulfatase A-like enzyme